MNLETISSENLNKELAYLLGVYLTDGSISYTESYTFSLKAIDKDFVENTLKSFKKINSNCSANVYLQKARDRYWPDGRVSKTQDQYCINVGFSKFGDFFKNQTNNKHHIPLIIWDASLNIKRWFIAGAMDGDGWISKTKREYGDNIYQYRIGIGGVKEGWIYEFRQLLQKMGVKTLKTEIAIKKRKMPMVSFGINVKSFIGHGLFFTIKRKQDRLKLLRNVQRLDAAHPKG